MADVLAAIELTPMGRRVADRSRILAERWETGIHLIHVVEPMAEAFIGESLSGRLRDHREGLAQGVADWLEGRTDRPVSVQTVKGSPAWEIARAGKTAALTVMGASSVDQMSIGHTTRLVAAAGRCDVLVVKRQPRADYRRVVAAVDMSEASARAVGLSRRMAPDAELTLVYSLPTRFDDHMLDTGMFPEEVESSRTVRMKAAAEALEKFAARWPKARPMVIDGPPIATVDEVVRRTAADLVVAGSRGAGATKMVLLGAVAAGLINACPVDVAVARVPGDFRRP